jgi:hypothetical protein
MSEYFSIAMQTSKIDNDALDIDAIYNLKLNSTDSFTTKLNAKFPWPPIMPKQRECILNKQSISNIINLFETLIRYFTNVKRLRSGN